jgi:hypothetical protein
MIWMDSRGSRNGLNCGWHRWAMAIQ